MSTMIGPKVQANARRQPCGGPGIEDDSKRDHQAAQRRRRVLLIAASCLIALGLSLALFKSASAAILGGSTGSGSSSESHSSTQGLGYWLVAADGGIFSEGGASFTGSTGSMVLNKPIVGMAATPDGKGYWLVASDGGIFNYGDAAFEGSAGNLPLNKPIVGMAATPDAKGYWLVASDGGIFNYGDAAFEGSAGNLPLNKPIVGMAATPDGKGYWLVASDGGIFNYGDAQFYGSTGGMTLNKPIVGMAATPDGKGYWLVASDGGIFNYGDAQFYGSTGGMTLNKPIVGMAATPGGNGYWLVASDGGIFNYGAAVFYGSTGGAPTNKPIVGIALSGMSGPANKLVFSTQPGGASGGAAFSTQPVVTVEDAAGNPVTTDNSTVTIGITPGTPTSGGPGVLSTCTSTGENNGVFTFNGCAINSAGTGYELTATDGQLASATSAPFAVGTGPATQIAFTTEPANAIGSSAFVTQPRLTIEDAGGNTVTTDTHGIALAIGSGPGGILSDCSATNTAGVVSFSGCSINTAGTYTLRATDAGDGLSTTSSSFDVGTGVPSQLVFTTEPDRRHGWHRLHDPADGHYRRRRRQYSLHRHEHHHFGADRRHGDTVRLHIDDDRRGGCLQWLHHQQRRDWRHPDRHRCGGHLECPEFCVRRHGRGRGSARVYDGARRRHGWHRLHDPADGDCRRRRRQHDLRHTPHHLESDHGPGDAVRLHIDEHRRGGHLQRLHNQHGGGRRRPHRHRRLVQQLDCPEFSV